MLLLRTAVAFALFMGIVVPLAAQKAPSDNREVARMVAQDRADHGPAGSMGDALLARHDTARLTRIHQIYRKGGLATGKDFCGAAGILQRSKAPDDFLLAHELAVVAIMKGNRDAGSLAGVSEDRFLVALGRPQRFGTQSESKPGLARFEMYAVEPSVTDQLRLELGLAALDEAKARLSAGTFDEKNHAPLAPSPATDNEEVTRIVTDDQADRTPGEGKTIDWKVVAPRDTARLARIKQIYRANGLHTAKDYANAALVLQHSSAQEDFLLGHDMCIIAILKGDASAAWLAAATEDRFLMNANRPQRFATQYRSNSPDGPMKLYRVDESLTDQVRVAMHAPKLADAKKREKMIDDMVHGRTKKGGL